MRRSFQYFRELNADQGDIIRIRCRTEDENTCGGGCFLINNDCKCYSFNTDDRTIYGYEQREASLNNKQCNLELVRHVSDEGTYTYEHIIPLDVGAITCQNSVVSVPYAENYILSLSNFPSFINCKPILWNIRLKFFTLKALLIFLILSIKFFNRNKLLKPEVLL